jgi:beta-glucanase (GH16 family)
VYDWARRNQPGLMFTAGVPSAAVNNPYLATARLSPAVAAEARAAAALGSPSPAALGLHIVAPGATSVASVGGVHFAAAGAPTLRQPPAGAAPSSKEPVVNGLRLIWRDEFDGALNPDWVYDRGRGGNGWGNNELQYYTRRPENVRIEQGLLVIEARKETYEGVAYTSARLKTEGRRAFQYGRIEARMQVPRGQGVWPAFWALGADRGAIGWPACGEIDVMENIGREPAMVHGTVHGPGYSGGNGVGGPFTLKSGTFADGFHVFSVDWEPARLTFSVDGTPYKTITPADVKGRWVYDHPFFLLLNLAIGGNWPGPPNDDTPVPARMLVDYVRVYERVTPAPARR